MKAHWDSHIEGKQVARPSWELSALLPVPVPQDPRGSHPIHLLLQSPTPHPGWQPGVQMAQCGWLSVFAPASDSPLAQCLQIKGQEWKGH